jgi:glycine cleavage system regulatory protein
LEIDCRPAIRADIRLRSERDNEERKVQFDHAKLAAALIAFCNEKRVPLPRCAEKRLVMLGDELALLVSLNLPPESVDELERLLLAPYYTASDGDDGLPVFVKRR